MNNIISNQIPIGNISQFIRESLQIISHSGDIDEVNDAVQDVERIIEQVLKNDAVNANSTQSDYHNLAVDIARCELFGLACDILEAGLVRHKTCDLLADFLAYGIKCGRIERCKEIYKLLLKMPKIKWNWRGYSFSIAYLTYLFQNAETQKEIDKIISEMKNLVADFHKYIPNDEEAFICEANVDNLCHEYEAEESVLYKALETFDVAPKAALKLADILFEKGKYDEAFKMVERSLKDCNQTQDSVSEPYLYYLSGLCRLSIAQRSEAGFTEEIVKLIYLDFNLSLKQERRSSFKKQLRNKAIMIEEKSGIKVSDDYSELLYLVES